MSNSILNKRSSVPGKVPATGDLQYGELAINYADGVVYYKTSLNTISSLLPVIPGATINGVPYVTNGNILTTTSGFTFTSGNVNAPGFVGDHYGGSGSFSTVVSTNGFFWSGNGAPYAPPADTASTLATARTIALSGDVTGSVSFDGSQNVTITTTVADDSHNHVISNVDGLQTALDGKLGVSDNAVSASKWVTARTVSLSGDASGVVSIDGTANVTLAVTVADDSHNHVIGNVDGLQSALDAKLNSASYTAADVLTKIKTVDGSGSGLDSDLLDGQQGSYYLDWTNVTNKPDPVITLSGDATGSVTLTDLASGTLTVTVADDSHTHDGRYYTETEADSRFVNVTGDTVTGLLKFTSMPRISVAGFAGIEYHNVDGTWDAYIGTENNTGNIRYNSKNGTHTWYNNSVSTMQLSGTDLTVGGNTVWNSGNDGANSGLDADLLDGQHGSYYLDWSNVTNKPDPVITLAGDLSGSVTLTDLASGTLTATLTKDPVITLSGDVSGSGTMTNLGSVTITATVADDSHNHVISNVDGLQTALDAKAPLASPALSGTPTAPTATAGANTTQIATTAFVQTAVSGLVDSAPGTLDTLNELAAALGDDPNFATTVSTQIGWKANIASPTFTGVPAAPTAAVGTNTTQLATTAFVNAEIANDAPTKTGGGASGTWGISVTGNAGTATKWATARTLTLSGAVTGSVSIDGSGNATLATTATSDPTLTLTGDVTGSATFTNLGNATLTATVADNSHNHTSLTGLTSLTFAAEASDSASISRTISGSGTYFDFNLADDNNNDWWRWRFTPSGSTVYDAMILKPSSNGVADLTVAGAITGSVFNGSVAWSNITSKPDPVITLAGDLSGSVTLTDLASGTLTATIVANSVALGTDTTGNYMINVSAGGGIVVSHTQGEGSTATVSHADTSSQASVNNSNGTVIQDITLDTYGHITAIGSVDLDGRYYTEAEADGRFVNVTGDTMTGTLTFNNSTNTKIALNDSSAYWLATATNWGLYWDTTNNTLEFHGAGTSRAEIDLDNGNATFTGTISATAKSFLIPHPTKPGKKLRHGSLEGPENGVYVRGKLKGNVIELPEYWTKLVDPDSITVQLTPIGKHQKLYVEDIRDNKVYVSNDNLLNKDINCFYYVQAERIDIDKLTVESD